MPTARFPHLDLSRFELPTFDLPKVELPTIDFSKVEFPKIDFSKVELPKVELPKVDLSKVDLPEIDVDRVLGVARDAAYVGVGLAVLGVQRAQDAARELAEVLQRTAGSLRRAA